MKYFITLLTLIFLINVTNIFAQLTVKDQEPTPNTLFEVNDEGNAGSITLPPLSSIGTVENKLYNISSILFWDGIALGTSGSAAGWTDLGSNVILSSPSDKVGIGSTNPVADLHVLGNEGLLVQGEHGVGTPQNHGFGCRMHFYPYKSAFRAGYAISELWDDANVGEYSVAMCLGTNASGFASVAFGEDSHASGWSSTAFGMNTYATGWGSTTLGIQSAASGYGTVSIGFSTKAESYSSIALGMNNVGGGTPDSWDPDDPLVEIGNGYGGPASNAMTILKNGNVGINTIKPSAKLDVIGDVKIGVDGIKFSEIIELTGTTGLTGTNSIYVDYPAGYTAENSRVLSLEILDPYGGWVANGFYYNNGSVHCYLWGQIKIGYPDNSDFHSRPFRLILMKVE